MKERIRRVEGRGHLHPDSRADVELLTRSRSRMNSGSASNQRNTTVYPALQILRLMLMTAESWVLLQSDSKSASKGCQRSRSAEDVCLTEGDTSDSRLLVENGTEEEARSWVDWARLAFEKSTAETL